MMNIYMPLLMGFMAYSLASGLALYFLVSNIFTICQYGALGKLHWENLKFWEKKKAPEPKAAPKKRSYPTVEKPAEAPAKKESTMSADRKEDEDLFSGKIDYREFKNKKKPKKNK